MSTNDPPTHVSTPLQTLFNDLSNDLYEPDMANFRAPSNVTNRAICSIATVCLACAIPIDTNGTPDQQQQAIDLRDTVKTFLGKPGLEAELERWPDWEAKATQLVDMDIVADYTKALPDDGDPAAVIRLQKAMKDVMGDDFSPDMYRAPSMGEKSTRDSQEPGSAAGLAQQMSEESPKSLNDGPRDTHEPLAVGGNDDEILVPVTAVNKRASRGKRGRRKLWSR